MTNGVPRHIVITGASAGIGRALALGYARPGVVLGLVGRDVTRLNESAAACRALGASVLPGQLDVRQADSMEAWLDEFDGAHPIDLLIANAGVASTLASAADWEQLERTTRIMEANFLGTMHAVLPAVERMRKRRCGRVVMVASLAALRGMAVSPAYCASKAAIKVYADAVRPILRREGVSVTVVLPGFVKTAMSDVFPGEKPFMWSAERAADHIRRKIEAGRAEIAFPGPLAFGMRLLTLLPVTMADAILSRLSYLPPEEGSN